MTVLVLSILIASETIRASSQTIGLEGSLVNLSGGANSKFTLQPTLGRTFGQKIGDSWFANLNFSVQTLYDDSTAASSLALGADQDNATRKWSAL